MNCYTLGHHKILGAEAFRDWNSDSRRSKHWYINNVTKNGSQYSWEKYLQTKNSGAPTVACDEDFCQNSAQQFNSVLPNVGFLKGSEVGDGALIQMRYFCLFKIIWKWVKKCHASASRFPRFFFFRTAVFAKLKVDTSCYNYNGHHQNTNRSTHKIVSGRFYVIMNSTFAKKMQEQAIWRPQQFVPHRNENIKVSASSRVPLSTFFYGIPWYVVVKKFLQRIFCF